MRVSSKIAYTACHSTKLTKLNLSDREISKLWLNRAIILHSYKIHETNERSLLQGLQAKTSIAHSASLVLNASQLCMGIIKLILSFDSQKPRHTFSERQVVIQLFYNLAAGRVSLLIARS